MRFGLHINARPEETPEGPSMRGFAETVRRADDYGFSRLMSSDAQGNSLESLSAHVYMATLTQHAELGPHVTNPVTRDPGVMAAGLASIDVISGGRAFLTLGRGDGAVYNAGLKPATVAETADYFNAVRGLLEEGEAQYRGRRVLLPWPRNPERKIPLYLVAEGPRMLRLAGAIADGVYVGTGLTQDVVSHTLETIAAGAVEAGRDPDDLDVWWDCRFAVASTTDEAVTAAREGLSSVGNHALRGGFQGKNIPPELEGRLREYHHRYDYAVKGSGGGNPAVMDELGLATYFLDRFGVVGTPEEVRQRLRDLDARGVHQITIQARTPAMVDVFAQEIMPGLADS